MIQESLSHMKLLRIPSKKRRCNLNLIKLLLRLFFKRKVRDKSHILKLRKIWDRCASFFPLAPGVTVTPVSLSSLSAEWITPKTRPIATVLYIHGGGYCLGSLKTYRAFLSYFCTITNTRVLSFDYRLAPENPYPAGLNDALKIYKELLQQSSGSSVYIAGDSAGGGLALALLLLLKEEKIPFPKAVICFSPWLDLTHQGETFITNQEKDILLYAPSLPIVAKLYTADNDPSHPHFSPLRGNLSNLPPLFIQVAQEEILLSDSLRLFDKIKNAEGSLTLEVWENMFHAWPYLAPFLPEAREALMHIKEFLKRNETSKK
ncbi:MAG: alpha/beta hydrolase [Alphaproteobacteria bacterium]|nr:alpha/beta hydrolase [Alphaproteobacteria bacterium]